MTWPDSTCRMRAGARVIGIYGVKGNASGHEQYNMQREHHAD